jgi:hypothetical protein
MSRELYRTRHRHARIGNLGMLAMSMSGLCFEWFLTQVYDLRHPRIGSERHPAFPRSFDSLRQDVRVRRGLG